MCCRCQSTPVQCCICRKFLTLLDFLLENLTVQLENRQSSWENFANMNSFPDINRVVYFTLELAFTAIDINEADLESLNSITVLFFLRSLQLSILVSIESTTVFYLWEISLLFFFLAKGSTTFKSSSLFFDSGFRQVQSRKGHFCLVFLFSFCTRVECYHGAGRAKKIL